MNNIHKYKTSFIAKATTLASLLIFLSIGTAWGQQTTIQPGTHTFQCGTTYNYKATTEGTYTFTNSTGADITISGITVHTLRYTNFIGTTYNTVTIGGNTPNNITYSNTRCGRYSGFISNYDIFPGTGTASVTIANNTSVDFVISNNINNGTTDCTPAGFSFTVTTSICCPDCPTLTETIATTNGATSATLSWGEVSTDATYSVAVTKDGTPYNDGTYNAERKESLTLDNLPNGTYTWTLTFIAEGCTVSCEERTFVVCNGTLDCVDPRSMYPRYNTIDTLGKRWLSWDPVPCADKYEIYVAPVSVGHDNLLTSDVTKKYTTQGTEYLLPIVPEGNYYWTVIPINTNGNDDPNDDVKAQDCGVYTFCVKYETSSNHSISPSTQGKEFFFSLMQNGYYDNGNIHKYTAIIAPKESGTVTFHYYADNTANTAYTVEKGQTYTVDLREALVYHPDVDATGEDEYRNRTVRVTSTADISLYIANEATNSFDASIVLPTHALGTDYMIQTFPNSDETIYPRYACFMIIATEDDTPITISGSNTSHITPEATNITLNAGESYFVKSTTHGSSNNDLSGIRISVTPRTGYPEDNCKTIVVFNGNTLTGVPTSMDDNHDHLVEQAYPITNWGKKFAITSTDGYNDSEDTDDVDYIRITAAEDDTKISIYQTDNNGNITTTATSTIATAGGSYAFPLHRSKGSCYIETTKPAACYLYQRSADQWNNDNMGDPSMVWMSPIERGIEQITFSTFAATGINSANHWVNIAIPADALSTTDPTKFVKLDGDNISNSFIPLSGNPDYMYARIKINHGTHTLVSEGKGKMVVHVYGLGDVRGYAYTAGSAAVPFRSSITLASGEGPAVDVETVPSDYHFCGGVTYRFNTNSNSSNVDSVLFDFDDGKGIQKLILAKNPTGLAYELPARPEEYKITAYIYSTIYDNELCQNSIVVDTVKDKALVFVPANEHIYDTVCNGTPYTFKRSYWTYNNDGVLEEHFVEFTSDAVTEQMDPITINGYSEFGCPLQILFHLTVYPAVDGGSIEKEEVECKGSNLSITKLVNVVSASGGDPSAHYQWQKLEDGNWVDIAGQTNDSYTVTAAGTYRRAYLSDCGDAHSTSTGAIVVEHAGSFNPGTHIDDTVNICYGSTFSRTLGGDINASSIYLHTDGKYYTPIEGEADVPVPMQWQDSVPGGQWKTIDGATDYNYTIPTDKTFTQTTYYRRIITGVGSCGLAMNMGVFGVILKPDFTANEEVLAGCNGENNAVVTYTITGGSGNFTVSYSGPTSGTAALENGVYKCSPLRQNATYTFTILDNVHGCEKSETVTITEPGDISISQASAIAGCQGAEIDIPIPEITGGVAPYSVGITSTGLGLPNAGYTIDNVQPSTQTSYSYTIPLGISAERKTIHYKVTDANGCTKEVGQDVVTVKAIPQFTLTPENVTSCSNPDGKITATITNHTAETKYDYYINDALMGDDQDEAYTFTGLAQGVHTIKVTADNQCSAEQTETVSDDLQLNVEVSVSGATKSGEVYYACPNAQVTIDIVEIDDNVLSGDGGVAANYEYRFSDAGDYGDEYSYKPTTATSCNTSLEVPIYVRQISSGCVDDDLKVTIITQDNTKPEISGDFNNVDVNTYFCTTFQVPDLTEQIRNATTDNCVADKADFEVTQTIASGDYPVSSGEKTITVKVTDLCGNYASREITVTPVPWDNFEITADKYPNCYCHGDNITLSTRLFEVADADDNAKITYEWYKVTNPGASETLSDPLDKNTAKYSGGDKHELIINSATEADGGTYRVVISDPNGCTRSADVEICVHQAIEFHLE